MKRSAFTLLELLVCLGILLCLALLLIPAVMSARERARALVCQSNLAQIGRAIALHEVSDHKLPVGCVGCSQKTSPTDRLLTSWNTQLLPFLELNALASKYNFTAPSYTSPNREVGSFRIITFLCPTTPIEKDASTTGLWKQQAFTDYGGLYGVEGDGHDADNYDTLQTLREDSLGVFVYDHAVAYREILDGLSTTAAVGEATTRRISSMEWASGHNIFAQECENPINGPRLLSNELGSPHPNGAMILFCDEHVSFLLDEVQQQVLNALITRAGEQR